MLIMLKELVQVLDKKSWMSIMNDNKNDGPAAFAALQSP